MQTEDVTDPTQSIDYRMCTDGRSSPCHGGLTLANCPCPQTIYQLFRTISFVPRPSRVFQNCWVEKVYNVLYFFVLENPPEEYWRVLAERRRLALAETLEENEQLHDQVEKLKAQVSELENQVKDTNYFAMMYKLASTSEPEIH